MSAKVNSDKVIFNFEDKSQAERWAAINDNVMGGLSKGGPSHSKDSCLIFSGSISLENNGGFSSIRTLPDIFDLSGYIGIRIRVKGDGRAYQFRVRTDRGFDGVAYKQEFQTTADTWIEIDLPFELFLPTFRGRILKDVKQLDPSKIRQMGFLIADKSAGKFNLIVDQIKVYR